MKNSNLVIESQELSEKKWSIKEKLFLISFVLLNGDTNWNEASDCLNEFLSHTTSNSSTANNTPSLKRTNIQCSKQYRQMLKLYATKYGGLCDLKKIYNQLMEERLKELNGRLVLSKQEYADVCNEIERILSMDAGNFEQLSKNWLEFKVHNLGKLVESKEPNDSQQLTCLIESYKEVRSTKLRGEDDLELSKNVEKLLTFELDKQIKAKQLAEEERLKALEEERIRELEKAQQIAMEVSTVSDDITTGKDITNQAEGAGDKPSGKPVENENADVICKLESIDKSQNMESSGKENENPANDEKSTAIDKENIKTCLSTEPCEEQTGPEIKIKSEKLPQQSKETPATLESTTINPVEIKEETIENPTTTTTTTNTTSENTTLTNQNPDRFTGSSSDDDDDDDLPLSEMINRSTKEPATPKTDSTPPTNTTESCLKEPKPPSAESSTTSRKPVKKSGPAETKPSSNNVVTRSRSSSKVNVLLSSSSSSPSSSLPSSTSSASAHSSSSDSSTEEEQSPSAKQTVKGKPKIASCKNSPTKDAAILSESTTRLNTPRSGRNHPGDDSELIFAPEIKNRQLSVYDDIDNDNKANSSVFDLSDHDERKLKVKEGHKKPTMHTPKGKISKSDEQQIAASSREPEQPVENEQDDTGANRTLRSNKKPRTVSSTNQQQQQQQQSKRRSVSTKSAVEASKVPPVDVNTSTSSSVTDVANKSDTQESTTTGVETTSGLVSIIKQEPILLSSQLSDSQNLAGESGSDAGKIPKEMKFEDEKAYKAWKKSIMMVLNNISCHKHATIFMQPVKDEIAPGYSNVVFRPIDLSTIKKNIENGQIKSTKVFQRDVMLMFTNAIMYNSSNHDIHKISLEMYKEVLNDIEQLLNAQEAIGEDTKPLRFKDIRSSTTSDKGITGNESERLDESTNEMVVNLIMKSKKETIKEESYETSSVKSNSTVSTPHTSTSRSAKGKNSAAPPPSTDSNTDTIKNTPVTRKRRPSNSTPTPSTNDTSISSEQSKSKRRKSGR